MTAPAQAQGVVRRWIVFAILFVLVVTAANGLSDLLGRVFAPPPEDWGNYGLAGSLAAAVIATPLAVLVWWLSWRRQSPADRASVAWGLYVAAMYVLALVTFSLAALRTLADAAIGVWAGQSCATAVVWLVVWMLHALLHAHRTKGPTALATLPFSLAAAWGLALAAFGAIRTLQRLFDRAFSLTALGEVGLGVGWWSQLLSIAVWGAGGILIWWWHWRRARGFRGGVADIVLLLSGVLAPAVVTLVGVGLLLSVGLRLLIDRSSSLELILDPLPLATAAAAVGVIVWLGNRASLTMRSEATRTAGVLIVAGVGLAGLASGLGVVINALLSVVSTPLAGSDAEALLSAGIAALVVGGVTWVLAWHPHRPVERPDPARRIYLVVIFGGAAIVALVALLVIGSRVFEVVIGEGGAALERVRAPLGLLLAAALVAAYHFAIWRREGVPAASARPGAPATIMLVAADAGALRAAITEKTGATVRVWERADGAADASADAVLAALEGVDAARVLLLAADPPRAIPLA